MVKNLGQMLRIMLLLALLTSQLATSQVVQAAEPRVYRPESVGMSSERLQRIGTVMQNYIDTKRVPGTITAIMRRGKLVHFDVRGLADVEKGTPMQADTIFRIASMTKPITSVALMQLWEQGKFQLRDPVSKFLPDFADLQVQHEDGSLTALDRPIEIRDLLTHTAGLANSYRGDVARYRRVMAGQTNDDLTSFLKRLTSLPLNYQPGTQWQYSIATDVVGRLVEVMSGVPLDQYLRNEIFTPLGMPDTAFYPTAEQSIRLSAQYQPDDKGYIKLADPAGAASRWMTGPQMLFRGAGGLVSTINDYLRFQQMMLNGGKLDKVRLLAPATVSLMLENHTGTLPLWLAGPGMGFGLGYGVVVDRGAAATPLSLGAGYWGGAYCTLSWLDPKQELVAVLMTQVRPYTHLNIRHDFQNLAYQAIVE